MSTSDISAPRDEPIGTGASDANAADPAQPTSAGEPQMPPADGGIVVPPKPAPPRYAPPQGAAVQPAGAVEPAPRAPAAPVPPYAAAAMPPYAAAAMPPYASGSAAAPLHQGQGAVVPRYAPPGAAAPYGAYPAGPVPMPARPGKGISLTAGWLGIAGAVLGIIPFVGFITWTASFAALIIGIVALARRAEGRGWAITGLVLGILGITVLPLAAMALRIFGIFLLL